jgi:hypothetical protein
MLGGEGGKTSKNDKERHTPPFSFSPIQKRLLVSLAFSVLTVNSMLLLKDNNK